MSTCIETQNLILHNSLPLKWNANEDIVPNDDSAKKKQCRDMNIYIYRNNNEYLNLLVHNSLPLTWTAEFVPYKKCDSVKKGNCREINIYMYINKTSNSSQFSATEVDCRDCPLQRIEKYVPLRKKRIDEKMEIYRNKTSNSTQFSATEEDCRDCP